MSVNGDVYHLLFIGLPAVGKSSLINQIIRGTFIAKYEHTKMWIQLSEVRFGSRGMVFHDTNGSDEIDLLLALLPKQQSAIILVYDVTDSMSLHYVQAQLPVLREKRPECPILLLGNKIDKQDRVISLDDVKKEACQWSCMVAESSATTNYLAKQPILDFLTKTAMSSKSKESSIDKPCIVKPNRSGCFTHLLKFLMVQIHKSHNEPTTQNSPAKLGRL